MLLMTLTAPLAHADELTVAGNGGTSNSNSTFFPVYGQYMDTDGTMSQVIYSSSLLADVAGSNITSIMYYPDRALTSVAGVKLQVSLMETDVEEFETATALTGFTEANGSYTITGTEENNVIVFQLDNPLNILALKTWLLK